MLTVYVPLGFRVDESSAPAGGGGAAQEEMLHAAVLPRPQFRCEPPWPARVPSVPWLASFVRLMWAGLIPWLSNQELILLPKLVSNLWQSCLSLPSVGLLA